MEFNRVLDAFILEHQDERNTLFRVDHVDSGEWLLIDPVAGVLSFGDDSTTAPQGLLGCSDAIQRGEVAARFAGAGLSALRELDWAGDPGSPTAASSANPEPEQQPQGSAREAHLRDVRAMPKLDQAALDDFCQVWADTGYIEYVNDGEAYYVLFDSQLYEEVDPSVRDGVLKAIDTLGLAIVDSLTGEHSGEIWVRCDPRVDLELEEWG